MAEAAAVSAQTAEAAASPGAGPSPEGGWITLREACQELGLSERQVRRRLEAEDWQTMTVTFKRGVRRLVRRSDVLKSKKLDGHEWHAQALVGTSDQAGRPLTSEVSTAVSRLPELAEHLRALPGLKNEMGRIADALEHLTQQERSDPPRLAGKLLIIEMAVTIVGVAVITGAVLWRLGLFGGGPAPWGG